MRELSSLFIAWLVFYLLLFIRAVSRGEAAYADFLDRAASPWLVAVNLVAFGFVLLHTVTWFSLTPQAMVVRGARSPGARPRPSSVRSTSCWPRSRPSWTGWCRDAQQTMKLRIEPFFWLAFSGGGGWRRSSCRC